MQTKVCKKCGVEKNETEFFKSKLMLPKHKVNYCRECRILIRREWGVKNRDKIKALNDKRDLSKPEYKKYASEYGKMYRKKNKEKIKKAMLLWRDKNSAAIKEKKKVWRKYNLEKIREWENRNKDKMASYELDRKKERLTG